MMIQPSGQIRPLTAPDLLELLDVANLDIAAQRSAVDRWLHDNAPSPTLLTSLADHDFIPPWIAAAPIPSLGADQLSSTPPAPARPRTGALRRIYIGLCLTAGAAGLAAASGALDPAFRWLALATR